MDLRADASKSDKRRKVEEALAAALLRHERVAFGVDEGESVGLATVVASEVERGLYAFFRGDGPAYIAQARSVLFNLKDPKNDTFGPKLLSGLISTTLVPKLCAEEMASDSKRAERVQIRRESMEEVQSDWDLKHGALKISGLFQCGRCKGSKTTYYQMQTRSSDEPMTTFVTCLACGKRWKF